MDEKRKELVYMMEDRFGCTYELKEYGLFDDFIDELLLRVEDLEDDVLENKVSACINYMLEMGLYALVREPDDNVIRDWIK